MQPILQVALDMENARRAVEIARLAVKGGADWVEAGTPLIKSEGMEILRTLKRTFPSNSIVADMKIMDVGGFEVEIAAKAGADVVTILAQADDPTFTEGVEVGRRYGAKVMGDLINSPDMVRRARQLEKLGVDYICVHIGVDQQMIGKDPIEALRKVCSAVSVPVAVAGGLNSESCVDALEAGATIIIVGGAIIKAKDVTKAARTIKSAMLSRKRVVTELHKKYSGKNIHEAFMKVSTPNITDAMQKKGTMVGIFPHVRRGRKIAGRALTVRTIDGDWAKPVEAIERAKPGEILVIDAGGGYKAIWGELASHSCQVKGVAGVVIDGAARDIDTIVDIDFPVFSKHVVPNAGDPKGYGEIGAEIVCGGQKVRTGDWVIGDENGVVVVPMEKAVEIANRSLEVLERENRFREEIKQGRTLSSVLELEKWEKVD